MYRRGQAPVFSGVVSVRVGGVDEKEGQTGISHMFEHMAFKGTPVLGTTDHEAEKTLLVQLEKLADNRKKGAEISAKDQAEWVKIHDALKKIWSTDDFTKEYRVRGGEGQNATTAKELTTYMVDMPRSAFEFWCWIESERLLRPVLRQFYQERDVVMEERRMRYDDSPDGKLYELLLSTAYTQHPYRNPVIGYPQDINSLTASETDEFRRKYYVPGNIVVSIVGDIDLEKDLATIEKYFGKLQAGTMPARVNIVEPEQEGQREVRYNTEAAPQAYIAYKKVNYPHPDDAPVSIMAEMLSGSRSSPLYKELVEKRRILSSIGNDESPGTAYPNLLIFAGVVKTPYSNDEFIKAFDEVIAKFQAEPINQELLDITKRSIAMNYLGHLESSQGLAIDFASSELLHGGWQAAIDWYEQAMAVTKEDIARVAKIYLRPQARTIARVESINRGQ